MSAFMGLFFMVITVVSWKQDLAGLHPPALGSLDHFCLHGLLCAFTPKSRHLHLCCWPGCSLLDHTWPVHTKSQKCLGVNVPGDSFCTDGYRRDTSSRPLAPWWGRLWVLTRAVSRAPCIQPKLSLEGLLFATTPVDGLLRSWCHFPTLPSWSHFPTLPSILPGNISL